MMNPSKRKKTLLTLAFSALLAAGGSLNPPGAAAAEVTTAAAAPSSLPVVQQTILIDGKTAVIPVIYSEGSTYIGLRALTEGLGLAVEWNEAERTASVTGRSRTLKVNPDNGTYNLNGGKMYGEWPLLQDGSLYVPLRFLLERLGYGVTYDEAAKQIGIETIQENQLSVVTVTADSGNPMVEVQYPQVEGFADAAVQKKMNDVLRAQGEAAVAEGIKIVTEAEKGNQEIKSESPEVEIPPSLFSSSYTVTSNEQGKLSLYVDQYQYTGGAHGGTARRGYTFDLKTGELLTLKAAAADHPDYVSIINRTIQNNIKDTELYLLTPFETIQPDRNYYLSHEGIVIYFQQYEYTPYAAGMPEFIIPYSAFK
ncbi:MULTISPECIES: stalk domain-containing protein [Paenibacillus]|uniref:stalk domain-containing protein n=1 Tax=Paenibacillus TaxID=44249 RepID=UPI0022B895C5|nr:stalk domain-containing protein [Paenibacillus caseinilyticus]MCZ8520426.1 stalk domain-containing protein [Paenibacillus caseinilyticus]